VGTQAATDISDIPPQPAPASKDVPLVVIQQRNADVRPTCGRLVRGSKGHEGSLVDGMVPRKGSAKAPFLVRIAQGQERSLLSMTSSPWNGLGSWGQERHPSRWVQGKRSFPRVAQSGDTGWMAL